MIDVVPWYMYKNGCKDQPTFVKIQIIKENKVIKTMQFSDIQGYESVHFNRMESGTYVVKAEVNWQQVDIKDITLSMYAEQPIDIQVYQE